MEINEIYPSDAAYPDSLSKIHSPPAPLFYIGDSLPSLIEKPRVAIVGSRNITPYGKRITIKLASDLANQGVVIVSGLAFGVDILAHKTALEAGGTAIAVLPGPLDQIVPRTHRRFAQQIVENGGALISEKASGQQVFKQHFIARNRLVSGISQAIVITEAREGSGTFYTFNFAQEQGKHIFAVPGNIDSPASFGPNNLLKEGANALTSYKDIMFALGLVDHITPAKQVKGRNTQEQVILDLILKGVNEGEKLQLQSGLSITDFNVTLTMLEVRGIVKALGANQWAIT